MRIALTVVCAGLAALVACGDNLQGNRAPTANDSNVNTPEDTPVTITVSATDPDPDDGLQFEFSQPEHGTITVDGGTVTYRPADDYNGPDSIFVDITDGQFETSATLNITVTPVNDAPVAVDDALAANEDTAATVTGATLVANDDDVDGDALTVTGVANPTNGTVGIVGDTVTFTPSSNFVGNATFEYTVSDGVADDVGTVTIAVGGQNDPPVAVDDTATTAEDTAATITAATLVANDTDDEMQTLSVTMVNNPTNGTVSLNAGTVTFTPTANFAGTAGFDYIVTDGAATDTGHVTVNVTPVNDTPVANAGTATTNEDTAVTITLTGSDIEGSNLTFSIVTQPTNGTLGTITPVNATSATVVYTPNANSTAADSFTFTVNDGTVDSAPAAVTIDVVPVNDTPIATPGATMTNEDVPVVITLVGADADGDALTFAIATGPSAGSLGGITTLSATTASVTYTPNANSTTDDTFTFTVSDGTATSTAAIVTVDVIPVNDPPVANAGTAQTNENTPVTITLTGSDIEGAPLTFSIVTQPATGTLGVITPVNATSATVVYTPTTGSNQDDAFTFQVNDGSATSAPATISIDVVGVNDPPVATAGSAQTNEDTAVDITLVGTDPDLDPLTFAIATAPTAGQLSAITQLTPTTARVTYTPNANSTTDDTFSFTVSDGTLTSAAATVTVDVVPVDDAPVANAGTAQTNEDTAVTIALTGSDVEGANLTFAIATPPTHGLLGAVTQASPTSATVTYTPSLNSSLDDTFTFTVSDGTTTSTAATVAIDVVPENDPPTADSRTVSTDEDVPVTVMLSGNDVDGDALTFEIVGSPTGGTLGTITSTGANTATVVFTPTLNSTSAGGFAYRALDPSNAPSGSAFVTVNINPADDPPIADPITTSTNEDTAVTITLTATDVDSSPLTFAIVTGPTAGTLGAITPITATTATVVYTPNANSSTDDSFTYHATGSGVNSAPATVSIDVIPVNDPPIAIDDTDTTAQNQALVRLASVYAANDTDVDGPSLTIDSVGNPVGGTVNLTNGTITFTPTGGFAGAASFEYNVTDGTSNDTGKVNITVFVNTPPVAVNDTDSTAEDVAMVRTASTYAANDTDPDPQTLTVTAVQNPVNGTVGLLNGTITFTPTANFSGAASFEYLVSDSVTTAVGVVNVTVTPVNDLPVAVNDTLVVDEDAGATPVDVLGNDSDIEGALTVTDVTQPANGTVVLNAGAVTFQPLGNFAGTTSFTYTVTDTNSATATATVNVTVNPINDAPVAVAATATTAEGTTVTVTLIGNDIDSPSLTVAIASGPANGTLTMLTQTPPISATVQYTPTGTFFGTDTFTFTVSDGSLTSAPATATITITNRIICGDSLIEAPETCDDANKINGDGCSSACGVETGWDCGAAAPSVCNSICGDMIVVGAEECDDMNGVETDGCTTSCKVGIVCNGTAIAGGDAFTVDTANGHCYVSFDAESTTWAAASTACEALSPESHLVTITSSGEQGLVHSIHSGIPWIGATDDGNDTDTVFNWVTGEAWGFTSFEAGQPDDDASVDGNGECLAIIAADGDWGDTNCNFTGFVNGRICELEPACGNGVVDASEACDDGNRTSSDGCSATCTVEAGAVCSGTAPTTCGKLVINEIEYDNQGTDNTNGQFEFVEIRNNGTASADLTNIALVLINNSAATGTEYFFDGTSGATNVSKRIRLNTASVPSNLLPPGGLIVVGPSGLTGGLPGSVFRITLTPGSGGWIQNGGSSTPDDDSVMLFDVSGAGSVVDSILYEGTAATGAVQGFAGTFTLNEGTGMLSGDTAPTGGASESLQRKPNGRDRQTNNLDFSLLPSTPGAAN